MCASLRVVGVVKVESAFASTECEAASRQAHGWQKDKAEVEIIVSGVAIYQSGTLRTPTGKLPISVIFTVQMNPVFFRLSTLPPTLTSTPPPFLVLFPSLTRGPHVFSSSYSGLLRAIGAALIA